MLRRLNVPTMQWNATRHSWSTLLKIALSSEAMKVKRRRLYSNWQLMPMLPSGFTVKMATRSSSAMIWEVGLHMSLVAIVTVVPPSASSVTLDQHKKVKKITLQQRAEMLHVIHVIQKTKQHSQIMFLIFCYVSPIVKMYLICAFVIVITDLFASSLFTQINAACLLIETELAAIVICLHPVNHKSL